MNPALAAPLIAFWLTGAGVDRRPDGGGSYRPPRQPCLDEAERLRIKEEVEQTVRTLTRAGLLKEPTAAVPLAWPLRAAATLADPGYHGISNFVDQNPAVSAVLDYNCGARTYDLASGYNHAGTDYFTWPFSWLKMDESAVEIVAAAPGTIVGKSDGNFDRSCGLTGGTWNAVYVRHDDGSVAWYGHMKNGSPTPKPVGAPVAAGEYLGVVGSSGNSTAPHLHLELYNDGGALNDPYAGPCNALNPFSWWAAQRPYFDSAVNAILTHSAPPAFNDCPLPETPNVATLFTPGQTAFFATYYRDQLAGQVTNYSILRPDGTLFAAWSHASPQPHYAASYWYWSYSLPSGWPGTWRFRAQYLGQRHETFFSLGLPGPVVGSISPSQGPLTGGTPVTITGANFQAGAGVTFDGLAAASVTVVGPTTITAVAPPHPEGSVAVAVQNPSPAVSGALPDAFLYSSALGATKYYAVTPCRVLDTRQASGPTAGQPLAPGSQSVFAVAGRCGVPATARSVLLNLTAVQPATAGHLRLYPGDASPPLASAINFRAGQTRANNATVSLPGAGTVGVLNGSAGTTHLVLDVYGFFQ